MLTALEHNTDYLDSMLNARLNQDLICVLSVRPKCFISQSVSLQLKFIIMPYWKSAMIKDLQRTQENFAQRKQSVLLNK